MTKEELEKEAEDYADTKYIQGTTEWKKIKQTYIDSAEPREKRIAELTEYNETLMLQIQSLGKENAELKESGSVICDRLSERIDETVELKNENIGLKNQLTKAKEHIKKLLYCLKQDTNDPQTNYYVVKYMTEAEQFLKDSEVEK